MNILICDDELVFLRYLEKQIKEIIAKGIFGEMDFSIISYQDSQKAFEYCVEKSPQIVFLDIDMPTVDGFKIAEYLKDNEETKIIFVSNYDTFVYTSLKFKPFRYIRKSFLDKELKEAVDSVLDELIFKREMLVTKEERIPCSEILYVESDKNYVRIKTNRGEYRCRATIKMLEERLKPLGFLRCHTAYVINIRKIKRAESDSVMLQDNSVLTVSKKYKKNFFEEYLKYMRS